MSVVCAREPPIQWCTRWPSDHYAPNDLRVLKAFDDRVWKWGYFTEVGEGLPQKPGNSNVKVLWVGRMLKWKRVDLLLRALASAKDSGIPFECTIVGAGPEKDRLVHLGRRLRLGPECLVFQDPIAPDLVRQKMRESDIYVLSSDRGEGWGAVAGEAMAEGCVLIANEQAGSARELIVDGVTGFLFRDGDVGQLASLLIRVGSDAGLADASPGFSLESCQTRLESQRRRGTGSDTV